MGRRAPSTSAFSSAPITATPSYTALPYHLTITTTSQRCIRPNITSTPTSSTSSLLLYTSILITTNGFHAPITTPSPAPVNQSLASSSTSADHSEDSSRLSGVRQKLVRFYYALDLKELGAAIFERE